MIELKGNMINNEDVGSLSGIDFENLCCVLLQKLGFDVETTKQSGDGGIDLIAYNRQPFLSGKYIVQCKRYAGGVGEPILRDLFGVVTAERANKGILITTGYFSMSAIKFASDKNIELIDGERLNELLLENGIIVEGNTPNINHFTKHQCFDTQKYDFFKSMINQNSCTDEMGKDFLVTFMCNYLKNDFGKTDEVCAMLHDGFCEEYIRLFDWFIGKYYKRGKEQLELQPYYVHKYKGIAQLYNFDLFEYVQSRYNILTKRCGEVVYYKYGESHGMRYSISRIPEEDRAAILGNLTNSKLVKIAPTYKFYESLNLLSLFSYFGIQRGIEQVNKMIYGDAVEFKEWVETQHAYKESANRFQICYAKVRPVRFSTGSGKFKFDHVDLMHEGRIDIGPYFDTYRAAHQDKIDAEIAKIDALLLSIT